jgi:hypothetical protein
MAIKNPIPNRFPVHFYTNDNTGKPMNIKELTSTGNTTAIKEWLPSGF